MGLNEIFTKHGIPLRDKFGRLRNVVDVLEDIYLKVTPTEFKHIMQTIMVAEKSNFVFDEERNRAYK